MKKEKIKQDIQQIEQVLTHMMNVRNATPDIFQYNHNVLVRLLAQFLVNFHKEEEKIEKEKTD